MTGGCTQVNEWLRGDRGEADEVGIAGEEGGLYLQEMSRLTSGDAATKAEIFADAATAASATPGTGARLRYALVLATPGHPGADAELAQNILQELLSQAELLTPVERSLATIHLSEVEERLLLNAEARRLRTVNSRAESSEDEAVAQRLAMIESENRQLRQSLAEAEEKLQAITSIERSIREQTDNEQ
jgi:molybdopterin-biosynthesis enzyme MoeA-like protein